MRTVPDPGSIAQATLASRCVDLLNLRRRLHPHVALPSCQADRRKACPFSEGGFNRSAQHLLILLDREVGDGDITDMVHGRAEGGAVGALEEWVKCCSDLAGPGSEKQDWRCAHCDAPWRHRTGAAAESFGSAQA